MHPICSAGAAGGDGAPLDGLTLDSTPVDATTLQQPGSDLQPSATNPEASLANRGTTLGPATEAGTVLTASGLDATGASSGELKGGKGIDCTASDLGYACAVSVGQGGLLCLSRAGLGVRGCSMAGRQPGKHFVQALPSREAAEAAKLPCRRHRALEHRHPAARQPLHPGGGGHSCRCWRSRRLQQQLPCPSTP
jgi:hypothetical protein